MQIFVSIHVSFACDKIFNSVDCRVQLKMCKFSTRLKLTDDILIHSFLRRENATLEMCICLICCSSTSNKPAKVIYTYWLGIFEWKGRRLLAYSDTLHWISPQKCCGSPYRRWAHRIGGLIVIYWFRLISCQNQSLVGMKCNVMISA